jgi:hypothetical protein
MDYNYINIKLFSDNNKNIFLKDIYYRAENFLLFFCLYLYMENKKKIKNLKISVESHDILKKYCDKKGIKIYKFIENLIAEKCKEKKDLYGE